MTVGTFVRARIRKVVQLPPVIDYISPSRSSFYYPSRLSRKAGTVTPANEEIFLREKKDCIVAGSGQTLLLCLKAIRLARYGLSTGVPSCISHAIQINSVCTCSLRIIYKSSVIYSKYPG